MFNVRTGNGDVIQLDFDTMTEEELKNLEYSINTYRIEKKERDMKKSLNAIIDCIEAEMKKCPALKNKTAIITDEDEYIQWFDLLGMIKDSKHIN